MKNKFNKSSFSFLVKSNINVFSEEEIEKNQMPHSNKIYLP